MNPMTNVKNITKLSEQELKGNYKTSWHDQYRESAWIFIGGLPYELTEGDIECIFSQFGEPINTQLVRDKDTGKSQGYGFLCYEDQRSTDLAVDNLNGVKILKRTIRVDHKLGFKPPKDRSKDNKREPSPRVKKEMSPKVKKERKQSSSDDSEDEKRKKKKHKKRKSDSDEDVKKKKRKAKKRKDDSDSSEDDKKRKKRKSSSDSDSDSDSSSDSDEKSKKNKSKKSIEELRREARLIQEELDRRQKAEERTSEVKKPEPERREVRSRSMERNRRMDGRKDVGRGEDFRGRRDDQNFGRYHERRRERSRSPQQFRRRSRSPDRRRENGHRDRRRF